MEDFRFSTKNDKYIKFVRDFASGWACYRHIKFVEEYKGYLIFHHKNHAEYVDRSAGSVNCKAYFGYIKYTEDGSKKTLFMKAPRVHLRMSKKTITTVKSLIDEEVV